ncbi:MAG: DMT family transporter [Candidatus Hodarchaeales archaeon]
MAIIAVSWASILVRSTSSPKVIVAFWRLSMTSIFLLPFLIQERIRMQFWIVFKPEYFKLFILSGFFLSLHFLTWFESLEYTSVAVSVLVVNTSPIWVMIISYLLFREKVDLRQFVGLTLAFVGLVIIYNPTNTSLESSNYTLGVFLAMIGALMVAFYFLIGKRMRTYQEIPNVPYVFFVNVSSSIFMFLYSILLGENIVNVQMADITIFILLALGPSLLGHAMLTYALKHISARTVSLSVIGETIGASILAFLVFHETLGYTTLIGGIFIITGIFLNVYYEK